MQRVVLILAMALGAPVWAAQSPTDLATACGAPARRMDLTLSDNGRVVAWERSSESGGEVVVYD